MQVQSYAVQSILVCLSGLQHACLTLAVIHLNSGVTFEPMSFVQKDKIASSAALISVMTCRAMSRGICGCAK